MFSHSQILLAGITSLSIASQNLNADTVAHWTFNNGTATDITGNGHDGSIVGAVSVPGLHGMALQFNGSEDKTYVEVPDHTDLRFTSTWTLEALFKIDEDAIIPNNWRESYLITKPSSVGGGHYALKLHQTDPDAPDNVPELPTVEVHGPTDVGSEVRSATNVTLDKWHHLAASFDNGEIIIYLDYQPIDTFSSPISPVGTSANPLLLGRNNTISGSPNSSKPFEGLIDEIAVSNTALEPSEFVVPIPEPISIAVWFVACGLLLNRRRRRLCDGR